VTNLTDHDPGSLRDAIATTPPGGTVDFQPDLAGTITLTSGGLSIAKDLTIAGPGADVITVSGNHRSTVFNVTGACTAAIAGLTITDGSNGGHGGGIQNFGTLTVTGCTVSDSLSNRGGGIANLATLTVIDSIISNNNSAVIVGGGIYNLGHTATVISSTLSGNSAEGGGGAIANESGGLTVTTSTFSSNIAGGSGGAIQNAATTAIISNSTLSGNSVTAGYGFGAGLVGASTQTIIRNTIIAANHAASSPDVGDSVNSQGHNLIGDGTGGSGYADTDLVGTADLPIDPVLGPLQDNGGPTLTQAVLPGSPALNAGDAAQLGVADQRGVVRRGGVNIGAYQASPTAFLLIAPDAIQAGVPFNLSVTAVDPFGQVAYGYTGTVTFASDDAAAVLPDDYPFQPSDEGSATFAVTLNTSGPVHLTGTDTADDTVFAALDLIVL
jgi:hypothetical protein